MAEMVARVSSPGEFPAVVVVLLARRAVCERKQKGKCQRVQMPKGEIKGNETAASNCPILFLFG